MIRPKEMRVNTYRSACALLLPFCCIPVAFQEALKSLSRTSEILTQKKEAASERLLGLRNEPCSTSTARYECRINGGCSAAADAAHPMHRLYRIDSPFSRMLSRSCFQTSCIPRKEQMPCVSLQQPRRHATDDDGRKGLPSWPPAF